MILHSDTGIGCDIEEIERFCLDREADGKFLSRVFTLYELEYCFSFQNPAPHLAARFCAKEAVVKALCSIGMSSIEYVRIEIGNHQSGVPFVSIIPDEVGYAYQEYEIKVSLSHCKTTAMAMVVITCVPPVDTAR